MTVFAALLLTSGCTKTQSGPEVEIILFGSHPVLDAIAKATKEAYNAASAKLPQAERATIRIYDASYDPIEAVNAIKKANARNIDALVLLGTPMIQAGLANRDQHIQLYYGATSDPASLNIAPSNSRTDWTPSQLRPPPNSFGIVSDFQWALMAALAQRLASIRFSNRGTHIIGYPVNEAESNSVSAARELAQALSPGHTLLRAPIASEQDTFRAAKYLAAANVSVIQVGPDNTVVGGLGSILSVAAENHIPVLASERESVKKGADAAVGLDFERIGTLLGQELAQTLSTRNSIDIAEVQIFSEHKLYTNSRTLNKTLAIKPEPLITQISQSLGIGAEELEPPKGP